MNDSIIVDTDILIDAGREVEKAIDFLNGISNTNEIAISEVTKMELIVGCRNKKELGILDLFLQSFVVYSINELISKKAIELLNSYYLSHGLLIADSLIASTSLVFDIPLVTKNQRDFKFIKDLKLLKY